MSKSNVRYIVDDSMRQWLSTQPTWISTWTSVRRRRSQSLRSDMIVGVGGKQVLVDDPSGNPVELFEYKKD